MKTWRCALLCLFCTALLCIVCPPARAAFVQGQGQTALSEPGAPVKLTAREQYEANIFLSNFAEQNFCGARATPFVSNDATEAELFSFAHLWAKINRRTAISYDGSYEVMTLDAVNEILDRYFERDYTLLPDNGTDYSAALGMGRFNWDRCWYENGRFYYPAADGESYNCFAVVTEKRLYDNGHSLLRFTVYELELGIYLEKGLDAAYYWLTPEEAAALAAKGKITPMRMGQALCSPLHLADKNRETYRLLRYELFPLDVD